MNRLLKQIFGDPNVRREAKRAFLDCREYGMTKENSRQEVGKDFKQLLVWHMRTWNGKCDTGKAHNRERIAEIERFQRCFAHPMFRRRMLSIIDELLVSANKAVGMGIVTRGNAYHGKTMVSPNDLDEMKPFTRAYDNMIKFRDYVCDYPLLWLCVFVFRLWHLD